MLRAACRRFDTKPACDRRTDGRTDRQTDGIAVAITALTMPELRRAVKMETRLPVEGSFGNKYSPICNRFCVMAF